MNKKILLIGGSGNLGSEIIKSGLYTNIHYPSRKKLDLRNLEGMKKYIRKNNFNIIINCASLARVKDCENNKSLTIDNNILGTLNLVKAIQDYEIKKKKKIILIQISTDAVYPSLKGNYKENSKLGPYNVYGWSKLASEFLVRVLEKVIIIRTRFYKKNLIKYKYSANDIFTSQTDISLMPKYIYYLIKDRFFGIINIGDSKKSDYEIYKKIKPSLKVFKRKNLIKNLGFEIAKDASLNLKKFNKIRKKYE